MARVPLRTQSDLPDDYQYLLSETAMGEINLLCAMGNNPDLLQAYMRYGSTLWADAGLDHADLERSILTVARALDSPYEWNQHVPIAREVGVPDDDIRSIAEGAFDRFDGKRAALLQYCRAVALDSVDDATFEAASELLDDSTIVGATLLATHYLATARFVGALELPLDDPFVGWHLDGEE